MKWLRRLFRVSDKPAAPPCPTTFGVEYLEWQCRYAPLIARGIAATVLADHYRRQRDEARLRQIISEELERAR